MGRLFISDRGILFEAADGFLQSDSLNSGFVLWTNIGSIQLGATGSTSSNEMTLSLSQPARLSSLWLQFGTESDVRWIEDAWKLSKISAIEVDTASVPGETLLSIASFSSCLRWGLSFPLPLPQ